jgi:hypothetical protein
MRRLLLSIFGLLFSLSGFSEANYVYHETTTNTIGVTPLQFRDSSKFWIFGLGFNGALSIEENSWIRNIRDYKETEVELQNGIVKTQIKGNLTEMQSIIIYDVSGMILHRSSSRVKGSSQIDISKYFCPGVNLVKIILENKTNDQFIFRILK